MPTEPLNRARFGLRQLEFLRIVVQHGPLYSWEVNKHPHRVGYPFSNTFRAGTVFRFRQLGLLKPKTLRQGWIEATARGKALVPEEVYEPDSADLDDADSRSVCDECKNLMLDRINEQDARIQELKDLVLLYRVRIGQLTEGREP